MARTFTYDSLDPMEEFAADMSMMQEEIETHEVLPEEVYEIQEDEPLSSTTTLECVECGRKFKSANTEDPSCPTCGSEDLELE